jgi:ketosteroid isomerase-like protein
MDEAEMDRVQEVLAVEHAWTGAHLHNDVPLIARLMDDSYHKINSDGSVMNRAVALAGYAPEERFWERAEGSEYHVQLLGEVALVIGLWTAKGMNRGKPFDYQARFLSVYVHREDGWKMVAEQSTELLR